VGAYEDPTYVLFLNTVRRFHTYLSGSREFSVGRVLCVKCYPTHGRPESSPTPEVGASAQLTGARSAEMRYIGTKLPVDVALSELLTATQVIVMVIVVNQLCEILLHCFSCNIFSEDCLLAVTLFKISITFGVVSSRLLYQLPLRARMCDWGLNTLQSILACAIPFHERIRKRFSFLVCYHGIV
jgi:hypothetical protein